MSNYNYLKIDFYGQFNADTIHKLTYPEPYKPLGDAATLLWLNPITDPRAIRTLFPMAKYGYRVHRDSNGTYFSYITRYERDARQGYVAITVMIGAQYESIINGKAIFNLLNLLKTNVLDTNNITATAIEQCLIASNMPSVNTATLHISTVQNNSQQAMRVYGTNEELHDIFQFPRQPEYDQYGEVFLINKLWCNNSVPGVTLLNSPIIKTYSVSMPNNVNCDSTTQTGNTLNITYTKEGFAPLTVPITVNGINNQYVRYDGASITILIPDNLPFKQRITVRVGINGYNYSDDSVLATVGEEHLLYSSQMDAYSADISSEMLSEAEIKVSVNINDPMLDPTGKSQHKAKILKWMLPIITLLLGAAIAACTTWMMMRNNKGSEKTEKKSDTEVIDSDSIANQELDIKYMKDNDTWHIDDLKSQKYKDFAIAINNGDVNMVAMVIDQLEKDEKDLNEYLPQIAKKIKQDPETAKGILKNHNPKGKTIDLEKISKELKQKVNNSVEALSDAQVNNKTSTTLTIRNNNGDNRLEQRHSLGDKARNNNSSSAEPVQANHNIFK